MRWDRLFDDLEAQLALDDVRGLEAEVADRTRRERALLDVHTRLLAHVDATHVGLRLPGRVVAGRLVDVGPDWALVETAPGRPVLVALAAVRAVSGLGAGSTDAVGRGPTFRPGRGAARREPRPGRRGGRRRGRARGAPAPSTSSASDHLELAEHAPDETRRPANVTGRLLVPFWSLGSVRRL